MILKGSSPTLRSISAEVSIAKITSPEIRKLIKNMTEALNAEKDGVALAAPQIGELLRIFIISAKAFKIRESNTEIKETFLLSPPLVFINPKLVKQSREKLWVEEGCLSIRSVYGKVRRSVKTTVRAYDENGKLFERGGSGILSQIFQHELDHLDGILFTDKAKELKKLQHHPKTRHAY